MKKLLYAASSYSHLERFHLPVIEHLKAQGHSVFTMAKGERASFDIPFSKSMLSPKNLKAYLRIRKILREERFDTVIANTSLAAFLLRLALPKGTRLINIVHGYLFDEKPKTSRERFLLLCEKIMRKKTDAVIVMNEEDLEIAKRYNLSKTVRLIPGMGIPMPAVKADRVTIRAACKNPESFMLLFVGELSKRKNQAFLLDATKALKKRVPNAALVLIGDGGEREWLRRYAETIGISESVCFLGERKKPADFMNASDLYVSASRAEGLPFNIGEALAVGCDVLASDIKGHRDLLKNGAGMLFEEGSIDDFVNKACQIKENKIIIEKEKKKAAFEQYSFYNAFPAVLKAIDELF